LEKNHRRQTRCTLKRRNSIAENGKEKRRGEDRSTVETMRLVGARRRSEWGAGEGLGRKSQGAVEKRAPENAVPLETAARASDSVDRLLTCRRGWEVAGTETQDVRKKPVDAENGVSVVSLRVNSGLWYSRGNLVKRIRVFALCATGIVLQVGDF
jgi:hypothetical protein